MSRAMIYLKVNEKDVGMELYPDLERLPKQRHILPRIQSKLEYVELKEGYMGIYHHNDSDPELLGKTLLEHYNTYNDVRNLLLFGDESCIVNGINPYYYSIDDNETWERNQPVFEKNMDKALELLGNFNYFYVFENNEWECCPNMNWKHDWKGFKKLNEIL